MKEFEEYISLEIHASDEDVWRYLNSHMLILSSFVTRNHDLQEEIKTEIVKMIDEMYVASYTIMLDQAS